MRQYEYQEQQLWSGGSYSEAVANRFGLFKNLIKGHENKTKN